VHACRLLDITAIYFLELLPLTLLDLLYRQKRQAVQHPTEQSKVLVSLVRFERPSDWIRRHVTCVR